MRLKTESHNSIIKAAIIFMEDFSENEKTDT